MLQQQAADQPAVGHPPSFGPPTRNTHTLPLEFARRRRQFEERALLLPKVVLPPEHAQQPDTDQQQQANVSWGNSADNQAMEQSMMANLSGNLDWTPASRELASTLAQTMLHIHISLRQAGHSNTVPDELTGASGLFVARGVLQLTHSIRMEPDVQQGGAGSQQAGKVPFATGPEGPGE